MVFLPVFGIEQDAEAETFARQLFSKEIVSVNIREIARQGGCLNCISWEDLMHNKQDLKNTPEYRSGMFRIVTCPVCGYPRWICTGSVSIAAGSMTSSCRRRMRSLLQRYVPAGIP